MKNLSFLALSVGLVLAACGGGKSTPATPDPATDPVTDPVTDPAATPSTDPATTPATEPAIVWKDMEFGARKKYMKEKVLPEMKALFAAYNPAEYSDVTCQTCHGEGAIDGSFEMPNPALPMLPNSQEGWQKLGAEHPKGMEFMATKVKPAMATLLGIPEFDPAKPADGGFGCQGCHDTAK